MLQGYCRFYKSYVIFFFNDTATTEIYTLSLHDALPISLYQAKDAGRDGLAVFDDDIRRQIWERVTIEADLRDALADDGRSEEHTSELQSRQYLVCRLLLEKKKKTLTHVQDDLVR